MRLLLLAAVMVLAPGALANEATPPHPGVEAAEHSDLISQVQEKLNALGFDAGPVNGDWNAKTQAALAQFQLSLVIPAGGQLDEQTLMELGVERAPL